MSTAPDRIAEIRDALASVPAPPWQWIGDTKHSGPMLATKHSGWIYVMGFKRLGTQGAQPAFPVKDVNGYLVITPCRDIENRDRTTVAAKSVAIPRASYDPDTVRGIDNPVAQWIEHSPQYVADLLAEVEEARAQRTALIELHNRDELIFGGFICLYCTPDDCDDPDDNVYWPCPSLRAVGMTDEEAIALITAHRAAVNEKARQAADERLVDGPNGGA